MANKLDVFQRLVGLETEYALYLPEPPDKRRPTRYAVFVELLAALKRKIPCARARNMKEGAFHAAGGAIWFETERPALGGGLIEGSTPECRSPRQVLAWQRAQDELLAEAAQAAFGPSVRLLKNDRDADGNVYGSQENYEVEIARGWRLTVWRAALILLLPLATATWLLLWVLDRLVEAYALAAAVVFLIAERLLPRPEWLSRALFGCSVKDLATDTPIGPAWLEAMLSVLARVLTAPLAVTLFGVLWVTSFVRVRRQLTPFLLTRPIFAGSGMLDPDGNFVLAGKAMAMNCLTGFGGLLGDRPIYCLGHFFKSVYADAWLAPQQYLRLLGRRQRLQIAVGDSNLADVAEYLRIGTTLLVLDVIEAGEMPPVPAIKQPIRALRAVCGSPTLKKRIPLADGGAVTALKVQRFYLEACRRFLARRPDAPEEARDLLRLWEEVLDALASDPQSLVGRIDWVTKRFILDRAGRGASLEACKKIDLRYHELSPQGYFERLRTAGIVKELVRRDEVAYARRNPPAGTPAALRGSFIREWAAEEDVITASWYAVYLGYGRDVRVVRLDRGGKQQADKSRSSRRRSPRAEDAESG